MAVIQRTEFRGKSIRFLQGIILALVLTGVLSENSCEQARRDFETAGFPVKWLQSAPPGGEVCGRDSCCSKQSELEMFTESKRHMDAFLKDSIRKLSSLIEARAQKFDSLFREMMNTSKLEFHEMFQKTYGKIYLQNADVFRDFFAELELYYKKGSTRLSDTLESFFVILYQRMFTVINSHYHFDQKYLNCVEENMKIVKPFGDVPQKFTSQLKRSFIATRTYYKALSMAAEVARRMLNVAVDKSCEKEFVQMKYCGSCSGLRGAGICPKYCDAVVQSCLRHFVAFNPEWDDFLEALEKVADRLVGPYNIEVVVEPLNIKISEAIMNFQDSGNEVSQKIFSVCGKPSMARRRRSNYQDVVDDPTLEVKRYNPLKKIGKKKKNNKKVQEEDPTPELEKLIREIKAKVRDTRQFWSLLPYQLCNNISSPLSSTAPCWNGTSIGSFTATKPPQNFSLSSVVKEQNYTLQSLKDQLRKAYYGEDVDFVDDTEDAFDGSGSGSGDYDIDEDITVVKEVPRVDDDLETVNEVPRLPPSSTESPRDTGAAAAATPTMPLNKALLQYLLPVVLVWFGGAISDLL